MTEDRIARMMALDAAQQGGTGDAYTKAETDALLDGKADLENGKVPASQLPSYVDDVLEYASTSSFPATGESGKIYVATYTNKTYRWGGSAYVEISESLALGETASTAYPGNKGKANADAIAAIKDGTNIDSFADVETALADKADKSTTYTKAEVDTALSAKLNTADVDAALSGTSTNPVQNKAVQAPVARLVDAGAKNLLKVTATSQTINGVTFTVNTDQTVTVNGTNTGTSSVTFVIVPNQQAILIPDGDYWLLGCPQGGGSDTFDLRWFRYSPNASAYDIGSGAAIHKSGNTTDSNIAIVVKPGVTVNNITFKPMLCTAEDYAISPEFVPYTPTVRELYEMILALQNAQNGG